MAEGAGRRSRSSSPTEARDVGLLALPDDDADLTGGRQRRLDLSDQQDEEQRRLDEERRSLESWTSWTSWTSSSRSSSSSSTMARDGESGCSLVAAGWAGSPSGRLALRAAGG